ncbi:hypothetical protein BGX26_008723 [Mortierella sp. AD094]|nr:hypothetical protein BGX26_008723 [Mortierella sp. AD094]
MTGHSPLEGDDTDLGSGEGGVGSDAGRAGGVDPCGILVYGDARQGDGSLKQKTCTDLGVRRGDDDGYNNAGGDVVLEDDVMDWMHNVDAEVENKTHSLGIHHIWLWPLAWRMGKRMMMRVEARLEAK